MSGQEKPKFEVIDGGVPDECDYELKDPPEHGWRPKVVDFDYMRNLGHIAGNPFYEDPEPPEAA